MLRIPDDQVSVSIALGRLSEAVCYLLAFGTGPLGLIRPSHSGVIEH